MATKKQAPETITVNLVRSLAHRTDKQIAVVHSLGLRKIGDVSVQPDNEATRGKIFKVSHLVETN